MLQGRNCALYRRTYGGVKIVVERIGPVSPKLDLSINYRLEPHSFGGSSDGQAVRTGA